MLENEANVLRDCVLESAREVFAACSIPAELDVDPGPPGPGDQGQVAAFIGFSGELLRGTLTLVAPLSLIRGSCPVPLQGDSTDLVFDWAGEIANQLLGRVKNKLIARGLEVQASTPKTMHAPQVWVASSARNNVCSLAFRANRLPLCVWFDAVAADARPLFGPSVEVTACLGEGEALLF